MARFRIIEKICKQLAVYWAPLDKDEYGKFRYEEPAQILCYWDDDVSGSDVKDAKASVFVLADLAVGGVMWLGLLEDVKPDSSGSFSANPFVNNEAWNIVRIEKTPSFDGTQLVRQVYLG